jgi:DNA polymerase-1
MPDDLRVQIDIIFELIHLLQIPVLIEEWYEADDIIGSLVSGKFSQSQENLDFIIISSDKDLCQFVGDRVMVYDAMKRIHIRKEWVFDKFWVPPEQIVDYLAICGDTSDNIPGIPGFWPKKAQSLLGTYGSLDNVYAHIDEITGKTRDTLIEFREQAFLSQFLAQIYTQLDWESSLLDNAIFPGESFWNQEIIERLQELKFNSLLPSDYQTSYKNISLFPVEDVQNSEQFQRFLHLIETHWVDDLFIDISSLNQSIQKVDIGFSGTIYTFHQTFWSDLFQTLLDSDRVITGYDIKKDIFLMKQYLLLPSFSVPGNQNSLF